MSFLENTNNDGFEVTPSDTVDLPKTANAIYVTVTGNVALVTPSGWATTFAIPAGQWFPQKARRILATGTTATGIKAGVGK